MEWLTDPQIWIALTTLTFLEIVLGVDNIIFISILSGKLPEEQQPQARRLGLLGAMVTRVLLLFSLAWIIRLTQPWFTIVGQDFSGRDLILIFGGLFLLGKSTYEIHDKLEGEEGHASGKVAASFASVILLLIGMSLILEGFNHHIPKGYIYFAMGFSVFVEMINLRLRKSRAPVHLHERYSEEPAGKPGSRSGR